MLLSIDACSHQACADSHCSLTVIMFDDYEVIMIIVCLLVLLLSFVTDIC